MKDWKTIKDNYAREHGYDDWNEILYSTDDPNELDIHIDAVSLLRAKEALDSANHTFEKHYYLDNADHVFERHKIRELITNENNIPL